MQTRNNQFSGILSYILHPLIIPTLATSVLLMRPDLYTIVLPNTMKIWFIWVVFIYTLVIPSAAVLLLVKFKSVYSLELKLRTERTIPLLIAGTSYMVMLYTLKTTNIPPVILYVLYSATSALLAGLLINMIYKISLHTLGWGAVAATLTSISLRMGVTLLAIILISWILSGLAGYARLKENAHNQTQVYLGYVAGVCVIILISLLG